MTPHAVYGSWIAFLVISRLFNINASYERILYGWCNECVERDQEPTMTIWQTLRTQNSWLHVVSLTASGVVLALWTIACRGNTHYSYLEPVLASKTAGGKSSSVLLIATFNHTFLNVKNVVSTNVLNLSLLSFRKESALLQLTARFARLSLKWKPW